MPIELTNKICLITAAMKQTLAELEKTDPQSSQ